MLDKIKPACNICGNDEFLARGDRPAARCSRCFSMERGRVLYLALCDFDLVRPGMKVLHIAPEPGIARHIKSIVGEGYDGVDISEKGFDADLNVRHFDLAQDCEALPSEHYDLIIHCHVLEHIACDVTMVLLHLHRSLNSNGRHVFCVPLSPGNYACDFNELSREEKTERFGQFDHVRRFGRRDVTMHLGMIFRLAPFNPLSKHSPDELRAAAIPVPEPRTLSSNTIFVQNKASAKI